MSEIEREEVLYQRSEEMQRIKEKRDLAALVRSQIKDQPRRSGREGQLRSEKAGKRGELSELKKRREEKSNAAKVKVLSQFLILAYVDANETQIPSRWGWRRIF
jgi:RNA polymerase-associated protein RTF1